MLSGAAQYTSERRGSLRSASLRARSALMRPARVWAWLRFRAGCIPRWRGFEDVVNNRASGIVYAPAVRRTFRRNMVRTLLSASHSAISRYRHEDLLLSAGRSAVSPRCHRRVVHPAAHPHPSSSLSSTCAGPSSGLGDVAAELLARDVLEFRATADAGV
jgi:hypothetical protein